jgi:hypothetical protein
MTCLLSLTGWIGFSNATVNTQQPLSHEDNTAGLVNVFLAINDKNFAGAKTQLAELAELAELANKIDSFTPSEQANIWKTNAQVLYELDPEKSADNNLYG